MKKILLCLALMPTLALANPFHCTIEESATIIFKSNPTSKDPKIEALVENDYMSSMIDMNTVKTSGNTKSVWIWNVHKSTDEDKISKLKIVFDSNDPDVFKPTAVVAMNCKGKTLNNEVNNNSDWLVMAVGSPAYYARQKLYGKKF